MRSTAARATPDETQIGEFWAYDLPGIGPPPVMFNQVAERVALQQHNSFEQNARMFALADVAMADAGIVAWDAKYTYNLWRPVTAIENAGSDGNPATVDDPTWMPLGSPGHGVVAEFHALVPVVRFRPRHVRRGFISNAHRFLSAPITSTSPSRRTSYPESPAATRASARRPRRTR